MAKQTLESFLSRKNFARKRFLTNDYGTDYYIVVTPILNKKPKIILSIIKDDIKLKFNSSVIIIRKNYNKQSLPKTEIIVTIKNNYLDKALIIFSDDLIQDTFNPIFKIPPKPKVYDIENPNPNRGAYICVF